MKKLLILFLLTACNSKPIDKPEIHRTLDKFGVHSVIWCKRGEDTCKITMYEEGYPTVESNVNRDWVESMGNKAE